MAEPLVVANPTVTKKLDLACGQTPREGFEGVDLHAPNAQHKMDLLKFPWPWPDDSVLELHCSHFIEHIACREVEPRDILPAVGTTGLPAKDFERQTANIDRFVGQDMLLAFFDECHRILVPGGKMKVICPAASSDRAFQDPTHRRFIVDATFGYLNADWRKMQGLDHYPVRCHFAANVGHSMPSEHSVLHAEVATRRFRHERNFIFDWIVDLVAIK